MSYATWVLLFLGMVTAMLLYNVVQWALYRERVYGLYTLYMLIWLLFFTVRLHYENLPFTEAGWEFTRIVTPFAAYVVYLLFTSSFLGLKNPRSGLARLLRFAATLLVGYGVLEAMFILLTDFWKTPWHLVIFTLERISLLGWAAYIVYRVYRRRDVVTRLFITGSALLMVGALISMVINLSQSTPVPDSAPFWQSHLTYMHAGIILELLFFSVGLGYRHRRQAIKTALIDNELAREREQRRREHVETELAVQQLKQGMTEMQMRALQAQINPHFLFNSLNSLSSLIADEPQQAEQFVDELSSVYRYLLRSNEGELTTLDQELRFIQSYYHLLKTRHGAGLNLRTAIDDRYLGAQLPPLTLQLLVENAVKHNIALAEQPLTIRIFTDGQGQLVVENNLQRKPSRVLSNGVGLSNILTKYRVLGQPIPTVRDDGRQFVVRLPLVTAVAAT
jgi:hypothetical protein